MRNLQATLTHLFLPLILLAAAGPVFGQLSISPPTFPSAAVGQPVENLAIAIDGSAASPYTWTLVSGTVPPGLTLSSTTNDNTTAALTGILTTPGTFTYTLQVQDANGLTATTTYSTAVTTAPIAIAPSSLPGGLVGTAYSGSNVFPYATGGQGPFNWRLVSGTLPPGMTLAPSTNFSTNETSGALSGTPAAPGTYSFTLEVSDSSSTPLTATQTYSISVSPFVQYAEPAGGGPTAVNSGPNGALWYNYTAQILTDPQGDSLYGIGSVTTGGVFTQAAYPLPLVPSNGVEVAPEAYQMVTGSDGNLWFVSLQSIGEISTAGVVGFQYSIPQTLGGANSQTIVTSLTPGPDGAIWFTVASEFGNQYAAIGRLSLPGNTVTYYPITANPKSVPGGITAGPDGYLWFTDTGEDQNGNPIGYIGRMSTSGVLTPPSGCSSSATLECPIPGTVLFAPSGFGVIPPLFPGIVTGPDGALWFTDPQTSQIGRISANGSSLSLYADPFITVNGQTATPGQIIAGPDGALWFTDPSTQSAGRVTLSGVVTEFSVGSAVSGITVGSDSAIWLADGSNIDRLAPSLALSCNLPSSLKAGIPLPSGVACTAIGGQAPYTYSISGTLPTGVNFNASNGALTGVPESAGPFSFTILASDSSSPAQTANQIINFTVAARPPLAFTCTFPSGAQDTIPYTATCATAGGDAPYTYAISAGALPAGLTLTPTTAGVNVSGIPTAYGTFSFTVQAADSGVPQFTAIQVEAAFTVLPPPLKAMCSFNAKAEVNVPYVNTCSISGGIPPYTLSTVGTNVPSWLSAASPTLSGTPAAPAGTYNFTVQVQDSGPPKQTVTIPAALTVIPAKLGVMCDFSQIPTVGTPYTTACVTTNSVGSETFKISSGSLPAGLTLNASTGRVTGTPTAAAVYPFAVQVTDHDSPPQTAIQNVDLAVASVLLKIKTTALPDGAINLPYSGNVLAEGGTAPYLWTVSSGALPAGLALDAATGAITGTPSADGSYSFTLRVTDNSTVKQTATQIFTGNISIAVTDDFAEYPLPAASGASGITAGPDGALWFTTLNQAAGNLIGRITTAGAVTTFPAPNPLGQTGTPGGITTGPDGTLWFTEQSSERIGQISTDGAFSIDYPITTGTGNPLQITAGPDGALWFSEEAGSQLGQISSAGVMLNEFLTKAADSGPSGVVIGPDNAVWFTESLTDRIGRITTSGRTLTEYTIPTATSIPTSIAVGADGALWFTENGAPGKIGRITTAGVISEFATPTPDSGPAGIAAGADGALYFTENTANQIGRITTDGIITEYSVPTAASGPQGIALGSDGNIWFTESASSKIARFSFVTRLAITCRFPPSAPVNLGTAYNGSCGASQGVAPYTYALSKGALPPGVTLDPATGVLSGAVTQPGTFVFTIGASDSSDPTQTAAATSPAFTVLPGPISLSCTLPPTGQTGTPYSGSCSALGGTSPYTYSVSNGALPGGLTLDPSSGSIAGTPTVPGTFSFTILATDSSSPAESATQTGSIAVQLGIGTTGGQSLFTINGLPQSGTVLPGGQITNVSLAVAQSFPAPIGGTVTIGFVPYTGDGGSLVTLPDGYTDPALQFVDSNGNNLGVSYNFTIPANATGVTLPAINAGSVAGTISLSVTVGSTTQPINPLPEVFLTAAAPIIEPGSVQITNVTASGFDVELLVTDVTLEGTQASFTFTPASGYSLQGLSNFTIDLSQPLANWYSTQTGLSDGGVFSLTIPFPLSGPANAIASVSVTVGNSLGTSAPVSGK